MTLDIMLAEQEVICFFWVFFSDFLFMLRGPSSTSCSQPPNFFLALFITKPCLELLSFVGECFSI